MFPRLRLQLMLINLSIILLFITVTGLNLTGLVCMTVSLVCSFFMINKAILPIQKSWQQQKDFLADASHEFRTPLTIIQTNLEVVLDNPQETVHSQKHWLSNIHEETLGMGKLVTALLFLARADCQQELLNKDYFSLNHTIIKAAEPFRLLAVAQKITLRVQVSTEISYYADETKLRQVVSILLDNGIRHTPSGGTVTISLENIQQGIRLAVTDTGEGIHSEHLEKIFERFYQSDSSRSQGGAGLGLSVAKWIVESHNGSISASSTQGEGSIFTIFLPHISP